METLWIRDTSTKPEEGWMYPAISGSDISSHSYDLLFEMVRQHYESNGRANPDRQEIIDYQCEHASVPCYRGSEVYRNRFTDPPTYVQRGKPSPDWPLLLNPLKLLATETDRGLGDIVHRIIGEANSDAFKKWYKSTFGVACGCGERQDNLNRDYPL